MQENFIEYSMILMGYASPHIVLCENIWIHHCTHTVVDTYALDNVSPGAKSV